MATIVAAHDLSGVGRCSLTTALAVLPAMGHHCRPLPTAVLSQQTGLPGYSFLDFTRYLPEYLAGWDHLELRVDMIYTGFLGNAEQVPLLVQLADQLPGAPLVVDPVMGDHGQLYSCYDLPFVGAMQTLAKHAQVLLPNATELLLLAGEQPGAPFPADAQGVLALAQRVASPRLRLLVVTGVHWDAGCYNLLVEPAAKRVTVLACRHNGVSYSGTGDLFASVFCGAVASQADPCHAVEAASEFVSLAADATPKPADPRFGLHYEPLLHRLPGLVDTVERNTHHAQ